MLKLKYFSLLRKFVCMACFKLPVVTSPAEKLKSDVAKHASLSLLLHYP